MLFLYLMFGIWVLLGLSILLAVAAWYALSWKIMLISCLASLPNAIFVLRPLEIYMYLFLVWFVVQVLWLIRLYGKRRHRGIHLS